MTAQPTTNGATVGLADRRQLDAVCDRFEAAWREGACPELREFLPGSPGPLRDRMFRELLALEREFRRDEGDTPDAAAYCRRFPEFADVINAAFTLSASRRDPGPATRVREEDDGDATRPGGGRAWVEPGDFPAAALADVGYEVLDEIGRGGMGVVYRAHQRALNRAVALKVIKSAGFASESERRRFQNEAESVAQLDHPRIVPIFEVGTARGLGYFSMKLVAGTSLDHRLDDFRRDLRAGARLVATVAEAIHHAHQRGILHRDLKPANILVDAEGLPYVTDFGLARRVEAAADLTHSGAIVGTPSYMSPEQARGIKGTFTTATDVYGLGAILYAVLTGRAPHRGSSFLETLDRVRETPPEPPSRANRHVPRDLEVICLKSLEKEPQRRYASAQALADDLHSWLAGAPIAARPVGTTTRIAMWCRRRPLPAALAALLALSAAGGFAGVTWKWREAIHQRNNAATIDRFLAGMIIESSTAVNPRGAAFTVREMLERAAARLGGDVQGQPEVEAVIRERVGRSYLSLGEYTRAEPQLRTALKLDEALYGPEDAATLQVANALGLLLEESGRVAEAEPLLRRNLDACRRALGPEAEPTLVAADQLGVLLRTRRRPAEAEPLLRRTLDARRRVLRPDHPDTLRSVRNLCLLCLDGARYSEAEALADEYERGIRCSLGPKHPDNVTALANRGLIRLLRGKPAEAEPFYWQAAEAARHILGPDHPATRAAAGDLARVLDVLDHGGQPAREPPVPSSSDSKADRTRGDLP
jgi:tetratricopeptide (TPR) repeat protein/predicted Ser/Thr protein kinase